MEQAELLLLYVKYLAVIFLKNYVRMLEFQEILRECELNKSN